MTGTQASPLRVLLVDDGPSELAPIQRVLESFADTDINLDRAEDFPGSVARISAGHHDIWLSDEDLATTNAVELARILSMHSLPPPILLLTETDDSTPVPRAALTALAMLPNADLAGRGRARVHWLPGRDREQSGEHG